jgi:hypothetical protein
MSEYCPRSLVRQCRQAQQGPAAVISVEGEVMRQGASAYCVKWLLNGYY